MTNTDSRFWGSYAMGLLNDVEVGDDVVAYLEAIDATLAPFDGRFLVHGGEAEQVEGEAAGAVVVIGFPEPDGAASWYRSAAYQGIVDLRTRHSRSQVVLLPGVDAEHRATDVLTELLPAARGR
jgi:uncharacterized protein (DUF1330 family)